MHLDQAFSDAALEIRVDETQRDAGIRRDAALGTLTVVLHGCQEIEHDTLVLMIHVQQPVHHAPKTAPERLRPALTAFTI